MWSLPFPNRKEEKSYFNEADALFDFYNNIEEGDD